MNGAAPGFDPFAPASISTVRVPTCLDSAGAMPCLTEIPVGWGLNLTDVTRVRSGVTVPSVEMTLVRTGPDPVVGYGTVAQDGSGDRVSFALRVPTGTVRGNSWADMIRAAGHLYSEVVAYGVDTSPSDHIVLTATLEPRSRSTALDAETFAFECQVTVGGGASTAEDCDIPDGALEIDQLRMTPRAWVSASYGSESSPSYRATKKVDGWRIDTIPGTCDATNSTSDWADDCYDILDPAGVQQYDAIYAACPDGRPSGVPVAASDSPLTAPGPPSTTLLAIAQAEAGCSTGATTAKQTRIEVRDARGRRQLSGDPNYDPTAFAALTSASGEFLLFTGAETKVPLGLRAGSRYDGDGCLPNCFPVEGAAIRVADPANDQVADAVYVSDGSGG